jgi:N-acyl-D-amino-acid deacylase
VTLLVNPRAESAVRQGITTQVVGHCGFSAGPVRSEDIQAFRDDNFIFSYDGYAWTWSDMAGYRLALKQARPAINVVTLVGHGALRMYVMGQENRPATTEEQSRMDDELRKALEQGALGLSSGLTYAPGRFSAIDEMIRLGRVVREYDASYHTHMREYTDFILDSIQESIQVAEAAGIPVNISHLNPPKGRDMVDKLTAPIDAARSRGLDITFDNTIWTRGGGPFMQSLPDWAQEGGFRALKGRLEDPAVRREIARQLDRTGAVPWHDRVIARVGRPENDIWFGRSVAELAAERDLPPAETALLLLLEDGGQLWTAGTNKLQEDINRILRHPLSVPVTDGPALAPYGPLGRPSNPRSYGTFPRVLGRFVRDEKVFPLETAVQKLTSLPAARLGIYDRGVLRPGLFADITVFNPDTVIDRETFQDSHAFPSGIEHVLVNGKVVVQAGAQREERPGRVL